MQEHAGLEGIRFLIHDVSDRVVRYDAGARRQPRSKRSDGVGTKADATKSEEVVALKAEQLASEASFNVLLRAAHVALLWQSVLVFFTFALTCLCALTCWHFVQVFYLGS